MYPEFGERLNQPPAGDVAPPPAVNPPRSEGPQGVRSMHVKGQVWAVMGGGGSVTVQVGDEGVLLVDTGSEAMSDSVRAEIRKIAGDSACAMSSTPIGTAIIRAVTSSSRRSRISAPRYSRMRMSDCDWP